MNEKALEKYLVAELTRREENKVSKLVASSKYLAAKLNRLAETLETGGNFNTFGEVQGAGSEIDRLCGELETIREIKKNIGSMIRDGKLITELFGEQS